MFTSYLEQRGVVDLNCDLRLPVGKVQFYHEIKIVGNSAL